MDEEWNIYEKQHLTIIASGTFMPFVFDYSFGDYFK